MERSTSRHSVDGQTIRTRGKGLKESHDENTE